MQEGGREQAGSYWYRSSLDLGEGITDEFLETRSSFSSWVVSLEVLGCVIEELEITEEDDETGFLAPNYGIDRLRLEEVKCLTISTELLLPHHRQHRLKPLHYIFIIIDEKGINPLKMPKLNVKGSIGEDHWSCKTKSIPLTIEWSSSFFTSASRW